jgi:hypothetical protein
MTERCDAMRCDAMRAEGVWYGNTGVELGDHVTASRLRNVSISNISGTGVCFGCAHVCMRLQHASTAGW